MVITYFSLLPTYPPSLSLKAYGSLDHMSGTEILRWWNGCQLWRKSICSATGTLVESGCVRSLPWCQKAPETAEVSYFDVVTWPTNCGGPILALTPSGGFCAELFQHGFDRDCLVTFVSRPYPEPSKARLKTEIPLVIVVPQLCPRALPEVELTTMVDPQHKYT